MQQNIVPLKTCITRNSSSFYLNICKLVIKRCFVKVKINTDIILSERTFDNGVVKRCVAYFLKQWPTSDLGSQRVVCDSERSEKLLGKFYFLAIFYRMLV